MNTTIFSVRPAAVRYLILFAALLPVFLHESVARADSRDFIVLANPQAPFKFEGNGQPAGIDIDVLSIVMSRLGISYQVRFIESDARIQRELKQGRADMVLLYSKKKSRLAFLTYPEESYVNLTWHFFVRAEDKDRLSFETLDDLRGLTVGATRGVAYTPEFWSAGLNLEIAAHNDLQVRMLMKGRTDIVALSTIITLYEENLRQNLKHIAYLPKPLKSKPYYNPFSTAAAHPRKAHVLENYDRIIGELKRDGTVDRIFEKYLGTR